MYKMIVLFGHPKDATKFEEKWAETFLPFAERMPGIRRIAVSHVMGGPAGPADFYKLHEFYFDDREALEKALQSEAGYRAGTALMSFAGDITTILFADVFEDDPTSLQTIAPPEAAGQTDEKVADEVESASEE